MKKFTEKQSEILAVLIAEQMQGKIILVGRSYGYNENQLSSTYLETPSCNKRTSYGSEHPSKGKRKTKWSLFGGKKQTSFLDSIDRYAESLPYNERYDAFILKCVHELNWNEFYSFRNVDIKNVLKRPNGQEVVNRAIELLSK